VELLTYARPYSVAAFSYAKQQDQIEQWQQMLDFCLCVFNNDKMQFVLSSHQYNKQQKSDIFIDVCKDNISDKCINFLKFIFSNSRIYLLPSICQQFITQRMELNNQKRIKVISVLKLKAKQLKTIVKKIEARLKCSLIAENIVDKDILGGIIIESQDVVIDLSLRTKILQLKNNIIN
jgi:F-type H+-transporting ATPase subunit delta